MYAGASQTKQRMRVNGVSLSGRAYIHLFYWFLKAPVSCVRFTAAISPCVLLPLTPRFPRLVSPNKEASESKPLVMTKKNKKKKTLYSSQ